MSETTEFSRAIRDLSDPTLPLMRVTEQVTDLIESAEGAKVVPGGFATLVELDTLRELGIEYEHGSSTSRPRRVEAICSRFDHVAHRPVANAR